MPGYHITILMIGSKGKNMKEKIDTGLTNIPQMNVGDVVDELSAAYSSLINNNKKISLMPSVMLWGPPGAGKSQAVRQIAEKINVQTGKKTKVTDVRLLLFNPIDLRGIPTANEDKTLAVWLKPKIFQMDDSEDVINILLLDEISAAPQSVQAAAYQITLDRVIGEHRLPDNCIVIAAGNRTTDKSVAYKMPRALANRLMHIEIQTNFSSWKKWAQMAGINGAVIGFLKYKKSALMDISPDSDNLAFPTPRTWEMVSNILNNVNDDVYKVYSLISGIIGTEATAEFVTWYNTEGFMPDIKNIFKGACNEVPKGVDELYSLVQRMTNYAKSHKDDISDIENSVEYARKLPADFAAVLFRSYMDIGPELQSKLMEMPAYIRWMNENSNLVKGGG